METLKNKIQLDNNDSYILFEQGGIGKTTQMKLVFREIVFAHKDDIVPVFVDCKTIDFNRKQPLLTHILLEFCGDDCSDDYENSIVRLENMLTKATSKYKYIFFIDGLNECENNKYLVVQDIAKLLKLPNNKIIVSSRINEEDIGLKDFKRLKVKEFTDAQIVKFLNSKGFKDNGNDVKLGRLNPSLLKILRIPMFLKLFVQTYSADNIFPDMYTSNIVRKGDLLQEFLNKIFDDKNEQHISEDDPEYIKRKFALERYLPALAYEMTLLHKYSINNEVLKNLRTKVFNSNYFERFESEDENIFENILSIKEINNICIKEFSLLNKSNDNYAFSNQVWQDFFCGKFYELCIKYDVLEPFEDAMPESVRQFIGEIIRECEFEKKSSLDAEASPIEVFLQRHNLQQPENKQLSAIQTRNLVEIMKTSRNNNLSNTNFSNLNLLKVNLKNIDFSSCDFRKSAIYPGSFYKGLSPDENVGQAVSKSGKYVAIANKTEINIIEVFSKNIVVSLSIDIDGVTFLSNNICKVEFILDNYLIVCFEKSASLYYIHDNDTLKIYIAHIFDYYIEDDNLKYDTDLYQFQKNKDTYENADGFEVYSALYLNDCPINNSNDYLVEQFSFEKLLNLAQRNIEYYQDVLSSFSQTLSEREIKDFNECWNILLDFYKERETCCLRDILDFFDEEHKQIYEKYIEFLREYERKRWHNQIDKKNMMNYFMYLTNDPFTNGCNTKNFDLCCFDVDDSEKNFDNFWIALLCDGTLYTIYHSFNYEDKNMCIWKEDFEKKVFVNLKSKKIYNYKDKCLLGFNKSISSGNDASDLTIEKITMDGNPIITEKTKSPIRYDLWCSRNDDIIAIIGNKLSDAKYYDVSSGKIMDIINPDLKNLHLIRKNQPINSIPNKNNYYEIAWRNGLATLYHIEYNDDGYRNVTSNEIISDYDFYCLGNAVFDESFYKKLPEEKRKELVEKGRAKFTI